MCLPQGVSKGLCGLKNFHRLRRIGRKIYHGPGGIKTWVSRNRNEKTTLPKSAIRGGDRIRTQRGVSDLAGMPPRRTRPSGKARNNAATNFDGMAGVPPHYDTSRSREFAGTDNDNRTLDLVLGKMRIRPSFACRTVCVWACG